MTATLGDRLRVAPHAITQGVLLFLLAMTPIFSLFEVIALFQGTIESQAQALTPTPIKAARDLTWLLAIMMGVFRILLVRRLSPYSYFFAGLAVLCVYAAINSFATNALLAAAGLRWALPIFLIFFLLGQMDESFFHRAVRVLKYLLVLQLVVQCAQFLFGGDWYGRNSLGFAARSPGFFLIPNTGAFFSVLCFFMSQFYSSSRFEKWLVGTMSFISVALTASGTGYLVLLVIGALCAIGERRVRIALPIVLVLGAVAFPSIMLLTGRGADYVTISLGTRVDILVDSLANATMLPTYFGLGTNTGVLLGKSMDSSLEAQILDSTYASIVVNLGLVAFVLFLIALLVWMATVLLIEKLELYVFTLIFLAFGAVVIVPECFPANLLFAALLSHYLGKYIRFSNVRSLPGVSEHGNALPNMDRQ